MRVKFQFIGGIKILKLYHIRSKINLTPVVAKSIEPATITSPTFKQEQRLVFKKILEQSKNIVSGWDGRFYFIYLSSFARYLTDNEHPFRQDIFNIANDLEISIIDIHKEVFAHHPDPLSLFPFRKNNHYNADGYRLIAKAISKRLKDDGIVPSELNN